MSIKSYISNLFLAFSGKGVDKRGSYADELYGNIWAGISGENDSGENVSVSRGSKISTVFTCINTISQDIAKLPFNVLKDSESGKTTQKSHPAYRLIHTSPNDNTTAFTFWYSLMWSALTKGNGLALILRDDMHNPSQLIQADWGKVRILQENNDVFYDVQGVGVFNSADVLHIKMYSQDGIVGMSPIMHNAQIMGYKIKQDKYSARAIGTKGTGFISSQGLTADQGAKIANQMKSQQEAGKIPFLGTQGDTKWNNQMITPNEAQYIETKYQTNTEIYGIYRCPPAFAQNYERATYANAEQQDNVYVKHTLTPWIRMIEQECDRKLFRENNLNKSFPFFTKFNVNGILRGDIAVRFKMYHDMILDGVFNADDVLTLEDMPSQPNKLGQKYYMQGAMIEKGTVPPAMREQKSKEIVEEIQKILEQ